MPAIASLEDLKVAPRDYRSMVLAVTPDAQRLTPHDPAGCQFVAFLIEWGNLGGGTQMIGSS